MKYLPLICLLLCSCVTPELTNVDGPGGAVVPSTEGVTFTQQGRDLWIRESVPADWFVPTPQGYHLTDLQWHAGNSIRLKNKNP